MQVAALHITEEGFIPDVSSLEWFSPLTALSLHDTTNESRHVASLRFIRSSLFGSSAWERDASATCRKKFQLYAGCAAKRQDSCLSVSVWGIPSCIHMRCPDKVCLDVLSSDVGDVSCWKQRSQFVFCAGMSR